MLSGLSTYYHAVDSTRHISRSFLLLVVKKRCDGEQEEEKKKKPSSGTLPTINK